LVGQQVSDVLVKGRAVAITSGSAIGELNRWTQAQRIGKHGVGGEAAEVGQPRRVLQVHQLAHRLWVEGTYPAERADPSVAENPLLTELPIGVQTERKLRVLQEQVAAAELNSQQCNQGDDEHFLLDEEERIRKAAKEDKAAGGSS